MTPARLRELLAEATSGWRSHDMELLTIVGDDHNAIANFEALSRTEEQNLANKMAAVHGRNLLPLLADLWEAERDKAICASSLPTFADPDARAACQRNIDACDRRVAAALAALEKAGG